MNILCNFLDGAHLSQVVMRIFNYCSIDLDLFPAQ